VSGNTLDLNNVVTLR